MELSGSSSLENVNGLNKMRGLREINIQGCGSLKDLSGLSGSKGTMIQWKEDEKLEKLPGYSWTDTLINPCLDFSRCENLRNIDSLKSFKSICSINFTGCESLESLGALEGLDGLSSLDLTGCVSLTDVSGITGLKNLRALKMEGCTDVKIPPGTVNMKSKKEVEKYQVRLFKAAGKQVPEYLKKSIQDRKEREAGIYDTFNKIKKLFSQRSFYHVKQGLELARSSGDPILFDYILEGISFNKIRERHSDDDYDEQNDRYRFLRVSYLRKGFYFIPLNHEIIPTGWIEANKVFKWTRTDYPYFIQAVLGLIAYAPPECKMAEHLKKEVTGLSVILPKNPDESYIDLKDTSLLAGFKNLEFLELINCKSLMDLNGLSGLKRLKYLPFGDCGQLKGLKDLPALEQIGLSSCTSLENVDGFAGSKRIYYVRLNGCGSLKTLDGLKGLRCLKWIDLSGCGSLNNLDGLNGLQNIQWISIDHCESLENVDALEGIKEIGNLKIDLTGCSSLKDVKGLKSIIGSKYLVIDGTQSENIGIFSGLTQLERIVLRSLNGSPKLKDLSCLSKMTELVELDLKGSADLETLYGSACRQGHAVPRGLEWCRRLKKINLINCKKLKNIDALLGLPDLEQILLRGSGIKRDNCPVQLLHIASWRWTGFD
ncbi:hypothetical protein ES705_22043 [subsurface metagenome]